MSTRTKLSAVFSVAPFIQRSFIIGSNLNLAVRLFVLHLDLGGYVYIHNYYRPEPRRRSVLRAVSQVKTNKRRPQSYAAPVIIIQTFWLFALDWSPNEC
jgi:hypothetical protein